MTSCAAIIRASLLPLLCILLALPMAHAVVVDSVAVSPGNATTTSTLSCVVQATGAGGISAAITWYANGVHHATDDEAIVLSSGIEGSTTVTGNIEGADTTKGQAWRCQATVTDAGNTSAQNSTAVTIANSPPVITTPASPQAVLEDSSFNVTGTATDADGDPILTWLSSDLNASLYGGVDLFDISSGGAIGFSPPQAMVGNHTVALFAYDGEGFGGVNVIFEVQQVNDPPIFNVLPTDKNATVGEPFIVTVTGSDEESDPFEFSMTASNPNLILTNISATQANVSFVTVAPTLGDAGLISVTLVAMDTSDHTRNTTANFYVNVSIPNSAPELGDILNQTGTQGQAFTLLVNATDNDSTDTLEFNTSTNCTLPNPWTITTVQNGSGNATGLINLTLTNDHVVCQYLTVLVYDKEGSQYRGLSDSQTIFMNITNVNDAPTAHEMSLNTSNSQNQQNLSNLTAGTNAAFSYTLNATDPDILTYAGDTLTFTDDTALFAIDPTSGLISFTPGDLDVGEHIVQLTVTDALGLDSNITLNLTVLANVPPQITSPGTVTCQEDVQCVQNFTATDDDAGEYLTFTTNTSLVNLSFVTFNISQLSASYPNTYVGTTNVLLTVSDRFGHTNTTTFDLVINNTNDAPYFDNNLDGSEDSLAIPSPVVEGGLVTWVINVTDVDLAVAVENLTFTSNITNGSNTGLFTISKTGSAEATISFTPNASDDGDYLVNITVTDLQGASSSKLVNFTVQNASNPPVITAVQPFNNGTVQTNLSLATTAASETTVSFPENTTVTLNLSFTDNDTAPADVTVRYYRAGTLVSTQAGTTPHYALSLDFFSAGTFDVVAVVQDALLARDNFTWHFNVSNVNRPPALASAFPNRTINSTTTLSNEMAHLLDPDDDSNSNGILDFAETNTMTFTMTAATALSATFSGTDVTLTPSTSAIETVTYTATDAGSLTADSNPVTYTIIFVPEETESSSSSGGGGSSSSSTTVITKKQPEPEPYAIDIISPKPITIYLNDTVVAPLEIKNTGTVLLSEISLGARTDANVTLSFTDDSIVELEANQSFNTSLLIKGFRYAGTYEVFVTANVKDPKINDSAVIYINSIERGSEGDAVNTKITYARDLLTENPACGELAQIIDQAERAYQNGDSATAQDLLRSVTDGCSYLKAQAAKELAQPTIIDQLLGYRHINIILGGLLIVLLLIGGLLVAHYARQQ